MPPIPPPLESPGLRTDADLGQLWILDQSALPGAEAWLPVPGPAEMVGHIRALRVRGAPMIGVCAALSLATAAVGGAAPPTLRAQAEALRASRPTAVNLGRALDRMIAALDAEGPASLAPLARRLFAEEVDACAAMAAHGAPLLPPGARVLTHCHTGALAAVGEGTALGVIHAAHRQGRVARVWVDETRPLLQGARITAWELQRAGVPHRLLVDGAAAALMAAREVDAVLVGADRIAANGDVANKIGTYGLAVLAWAHGLPFYVVAPRSTVDPTCPDGAAIPVEQRDPDELRRLPGGPATAPADSPAHNPAFDVTPARLVSAWILDTGVLRLDAVLRGALRVLPPA